MMKKNLINFVDLIGNDRLMPEITKRLVAWMLFENTADFTLSIEIAIKTYPGGFTLSALKGVVDGIDTNRINMLFALNDVPYVLAKMWDEIDTLTVSLVHSEHGSCDVRKVGFDFITLASYSLPKFKESED